MASKHLFLFGLLLVMLGCGVKGDNPTFTCPEHVEEGTTLTCDCVAPSGVTSAAQLTWPGHSATSQLTVNDVRRTLNGTEYTCKMVSLGVTTTAVYTLQVAYGPANGSVTIQGQSSFPTNGSQNMTLTCLAAEVNPRPRFSWSGVKCQNGNQDDTCVFQPQPISDDHKRVACIVTSEFIGASVKFASAIFIVDLLYPPMTPPAMTSLDNNSSFLRNGDVINCTVKGGKPAVTSVTFACSDPFLLADQADVMEMDDVTGVTSVVSQLRVGTSRSRKSRSLMCRCVAKWLPEESLYTAETSFTYPTEYKASVTNFTFLGVTSPLTVTGNDVNAPLTVTENDVKSVILTCSTDGRPNPNITLSKMGGEGVLSMEPDVTTSAMTLNDIRCEMTGVYICSVNNGLARRDQKLVSMAVLCGARAENISEEKRNRQTPPTMTRHGLTFRVVSNPVPDTSVYTIVNATTTATGTLTPSLQNARLFVTSCWRVKDVDYMALCKVMPRRVTSQQLGVYAVSVGNHLGSYDFHFKVEDEIIPLPASVSSSRKSDAISAAAIAGGILGTVLIVVILIIIGFVLVRRKWTGRKMGIESEPPKTQDNAEFSEHNINSAFVDTEAIDVTVPHRAELPRKPSSNFSTSSSYYDEVIGDDVSRSSLHPLQETEAAATPAAAAAAAPTPDRLRKKRSPRVSFYTEPDQATPRSASLGRSPERSPREGLSETQPPQKSPRYKSNESSKASKSPRNKQIKNKGPKSPRHKLHEARFPKRSPRNAIATSPPHSPRNNAFMTEEDGATFEERPSTSMSGDYAEIDCDGTPRNGRPDTVPKPRSRRSDYADIVEDPQLKPSPRFRGNNGVQPSGSNTPTPLPRGSVRGPLGDIYRTIDKALKDGQHAKPQNRPGNWVESEIPNDGNNRLENRSESHPYSEGAMGGYSYDEDNAMGNNFGDSEQGALPGAEFQERSDGHKPGTKLKPVRPYVGSADVDADVYNEAMSSRGRSPVKITSL